MTQTAPSPSLVQHILERIDLGQLNSGDSNTVLDIPLEKDETYSVDSGYYTVHIEVKDGRARFIESPCPDHICEGFGWLSAEDQTATCLPARAVLTIVPVD